MAVTLAKKNPENKNCIGIHYAGRCVAAFIIGIVIHGILDITPHQYPLRARIDILISIVFFVVSIMLIRPKIIPLFGAAFLGSIFPDLVDLGPQMFNQFFETSFPVLKFKIFPWHSAEYSGSIYDNSRTGLSHTFHIMLVFLSSALILLGRNVLRTQKR